MAGHSKWNNIKNRKAAVDAKRSKIFTQMSKLIQTAVREHGVDDPTQNPSLRLAIEKARSVNMTNEAVKRAIQRGMGKGESGSLEEILYEAYGPGGAAFLILVRTDNKQRSGAEIRHMIDKAGGSLGGPGSASFLFSRSGAEFVAHSPFELDPETTAQVQELYALLESYDDVDGVWVNVLLTHTDETDLEADNV